MVDWLQNLPVAQMAFVVFGGVYLSAGLIYWAVAALAVRERARAFKEISPSLLSPLGTIFALLVAFVAAEVWSDVERAKAAVNREAGALREVILFTGSFPGEPEARLHALVRRYITETVTQEWPAMARQHATLRIAPPALEQALQLILGLTPHGEGQATAQREMVASLQNALDARGQRIMISQSNVNWVKWTALLLQAVCTLLAIAFVHSHNRLAAALAMSLFATAVAFSLLLIASHNRPFTGEISVRPDMLLQVTPEGGTSARTP